MYKRTLLFVTVILAGCATTPEEREARIQLEVDQMIQAYGPTCDKLGFKRDADPWRDCVLKLSTTDRVARYAIRPSTTTCFGHRGFFQCTSF